MPLLLDCRVRRLIVNADDFGLTQGVNRAIVGAHDQGIVTSATLMANGAAFDNAIRLAQSNPRLGIGCHAVLVDGNPILGLHEIPSLLDHSHNGRFRQTLSRFAVCAISGRLDAGEVEAELTAQIRKLQSSGISVSHIDTHKHAHIFPQVLRPLLRAARACGVRAVRNPFELLRISLLKKRPRLWKQYSTVKLLAGLAGRFRKEIASAGVVTPDGTVGIVATGDIDEQLLHRMLENLPEGTWELVCHPGYNDADLQTVRTRLRESRTRELQVLTSHETRELVARCGIELISYRDLT